MDGQKVHQDIKKHGGGMKLVTVCYSAGGDNFKSHMLKREDQKKMKKTKVKKTKDLEV